jgi:two-component system response regulator AtoC
MSIQKILIADDDSLIRNFLRDTLLRKNFEIFLAENGKIAIDLIKKENFDLIITDMKMPEKTGLDVLKFAKKYDPNIIVIIMTAFGTIENAVEAMKFNAFNYLIKPFSPESIETIIEKASDHIRLLKENQYLREELFFSKKIIASSPSMKKILKDLEKIAKSCASVFISGESGTGKEVIANAIHELSNRSKKPFIKVNCAAISDTLIESEFFGHEKGSFTGADQKRIGRLELANSGTLLLDEVTEIPINLQPKFLRAIQEQEFERVGSEKSIKVDVRFISTSNRNIKEAIEKNIFREDLFFRLNVMPIHLPPLRKRKEDIIALAHYFLDHFCKKNRKEKKNFSKEAIQKLINYPWPGNIRELSNIIERVVVLDFKGIIEKDDLLLENLKKEENVISLKKMEKKHILKILKEQNHNKTKTAKALEISLKTLRNKLKIYNI